MDPFQSSASLVRAIFDLRVILDILLIAMGLFFLYRTLLRLGTWKIVAGILIALVVFAAANLLDLRGIEWIYSNLSQVALIALIVIFQPELRKIFERAASLRRSEIGKGASDLTFMVSDAVFTLAQQRRGAILVLPGKEPLGEWLSGGLALNADPSLPLIMSIFDPNSPGHDGAIIIENGKLTRFGVRLPVSKTDNLPVEFGTRHHAAMGLSEVSDALVVVSEERGSISTFREGNAQRAHQKDDLAAKIMSHWERTASYAIEMHRGKKKRVLVSELTLSLVLAFVFWAMVISSQGEISEKGITVPIKYVAIPEKLALVGEKQTEVKLYLKGPKSDLEAINPSQLSVNIDLSKAMAGRQVFIVSADSVKIPKGVKLLDAEPSSLSLSLREIVERDVVVLPQLVGTLPEDLKLVSVELNPKTVRVLSPQDEEEQREINLVTTPIYLKSITENTRLVCKIIAPPNVQPAKKDWPNVEVRITVSQRR